MSDILGDMQASDKEEEKEESSKSSSDESHDLDALDDLTKELTKEESKNEESSELGSETFFTQMNDSVQGLNSPMPKLDRRPSMMMRRADVMEPALQKVQSQMVQNNNAYKNKLTVQPTLHRS